MSSNYGEYNIEKDILYTSFKKIKIKIQILFMIEDKDTNIVYISKWLKKSHEELYNRLITLFDTFDIKYDILKYTNDFWCRDYRPVQMSKDRFLKYRYYPNYLLGEKR